MPALRLPGRKGTSSTGKALGRDLVFLLTVLVGLLGLARNVAAAGPETWLVEWPRTDFSKHGVPLMEIRSGGLPKDGIPAIDLPQFEQLRDSKAGGWAARIADIEPVISLAIGADARAYPLRVLIWHEIANDTVAGTPVAVTYCPLCNTALVFERASDGLRLDFGTTGKLRKSDLVMYDRQTESWWQQFTGDAIVGAMTGRQLRLIPSRLESFVRFRQRFPEGKVLVPNDPGVRNYGANPYIGYDATGQKPFLYDGALPEGIEPMERVVAVETGPGRHEAWPLALLWRQSTIRSGELILRWEPGQASALDRHSIAGGRDVGNVIVQRQQAGAFVDVPYDVTFAFAFHAFRPSSPIHQHGSEVRRE